MSTLNRLDNNIKSNPLFEVAKQDVIDKKEALDIENILFRLSLLEKQLKQDTIISNYKNFHQKILEKVRLNPDLSNLIQEINKKVFSYYDKPPQKEQLKDNWLDLLSILERSGQNYEIVTTNYDVNIEAAHDFYKESNTTLSLSHGFKSTAGMGEALDLSLWSNYKPNNENGGLITKLHGSVNWYGYKSHISRSTPTSREINSRPIIFPGFKGNPNQESNIPNQFHTYFERMLPYVTHALFIGFAFRDGYINGLLEKLNHNSKVTNIGFGQEPKQIPQKIKNRHSDKYLYLDSGFGVDAIKAFEARLAE